MDDSQHNIVRREQTEQLHSILDERVTKWLALYKFGSDSHKYKTQIDTLDTLLTGALKDLCKELAAIPVQGDSGAYFEKCRQFDQAIIWLERVWQFYAQKFDQRDDKRLEPLLKAADEVVWSCYRQAFEFTGRLQPPTPVAYVEPDYSPAAWQADKPAPPSLYPGRELDFLDDYLQTLPLPLLLLPPWCVDAPWWLIFIAHEIGHHIQYDLKLVRYFREGMEDAARKEGPSDERIELWGRWSEEIFADLYSLLMTGPWALRALCDVEWSSIPTMLRWDGKYPAPIVRFALMMEALKHLGVNAQWALPGLDLQELAQKNKIIESDLCVVEPAIAFAMEPLSNDLGTLRDICGFSKETFAVGGVVARYAKALLGDEEPMPVGNKLYSARRICCASLAARSQVINNANPQQRKKLGKKLKERTIDALQRSAEPGTRSEKVKTPSAPDSAGQDLAQRLLAAASRQQE